MRVLIVDDDDIMRDMARKCVAHFSHFSQAEFVEVGNGEDALEAVKAGRFDLIVTDYDYKNRTNGLDFVQRVHERGDSPLILMLSGNHNIGDELKALRLPKVSFLPKPYTKLEILDFLRSNF
jgi:CheY-like chemotaxis protein